MKAVCICASNILHSGEHSTSLRIGVRIAELLKGWDVPCEIIDLRNEMFSPYIGCGKCFDSRRCVNDGAFNRLYDKLTQADALCFVSPHYAPIPAKQAMLLEKMEQITFLHWWKDANYRSQMYGIPVGIVSHGGGGQWALKSYKAMGNDTIANAVDTVQCRVVPLDSQ